MTGGGDTDAGQTAVEMDTGQPAVDQPAVDLAALVAPALALLGWCGYAWFVFWQGTFGQPLIWTDSTTYAAIDGHPILSTGFWAGQRPPLVPLVLKLAGSATGYVALQSAFAVGAWGFLAFTVSRLVPAGWRRVVAVWAILAFASSTPIILWNRSVLSESPSLSLLALLVAGVVWAALRLTWPRVAAIVVVALLFAATRDAQVWTVAALGVAIAIVALVRLRPPRPLNRRLGVLALGLLLAAGLTGWVVVHTGRSKENIANVYYVRIFPFPDRVAWFSAHGLPDAGAIDRAARTYPPSERGTAQVIGPGQIGVTSAAVGTWIQNHGQSTYLLWMITHPTFAITEPLQRPERSFNFANGDLTFYAPLVRVNSPLSSDLWPAWWWLLPMSVVGLATGGVTGLWRRRVWTALIMLGLLGIFTMVVAWNGDGQEVTRHTIEGFAEVRLCVLILITVGVLHFIPMRRRRRV